MGKLHHLDVGCAAATVIQGPNATFLIDCERIGDYAHLLPANKILHGVFITHQHRDHYSGLGYLRSNGYRIDWMIFSPYQRRYGDNSVTVEEWNEFEDHKAFFTRNGTQVRAPYRQSSFSSAFWGPDGLNFWLLGPEETIARSETREIHDASLVIRADLGTRRCLFPGDASDTSLEFIAANTKNICGDILRASHHGSLAGAEPSFIKRCDPVYTVISTATGVHENVPHATALKRYADNTKERVYRTDQDGSINWDF